MTGRCLDYNPLFETDKSLNLYDRATCMMSPNSGMAPNAQFGALVSAAFVDKTESIIVVSCTMKRMEEGNLDHSSIPCSKWIGLLPDE